MDRQLSTQLMFRGQAAEAIDLYLSVFTGAEVEAIQRYGPGEQGPEGWVQHATLLIAGGRVAVIDSPVEHAFGFTPATSLVVQDGDPAEVRRMWGALADGGQVLMPLGPYPFSACFGWLNDRFGVSWQLTVGGP